jgi:hypothetical protein
MAVGLSFLCREKREKLEGNEGGDGVRREREKRG